MHDQLLMINEIIDSICEKNNIEKGNSYFSFFEEVASQLNISTINQIIKYIEINTPISPLLQKHLNILKKYQSRRIA